MTNSYTLITDSSCDLPPDYLEEHGLPALQLSFTIDGETYKCNEMTPQEFYRRVRAGGMPITAQVNVDDAVSLFEPLLQQGRDILYLAFSSGLSGSCGSGEIAAKELGERYPQRKVVVVDTLCASMGQGLMVHFAVKMRDAGKSLEEVASWVEENKQRMAHYVMVDDLMHLHRGGRVSKASAVMGSMLGIKPVIRVDESGKLVVFDKIRGRKNALAKMVEHLRDAGAGAENPVCFISHSDCIEDAEYFQELARKRLGVKEFLVHYIGPVIGSHTGAGTVAVFMPAAHR